MRILVIGGISRSLTNFRGKLLAALVAAGHDVTACAGEVEPEVISQLAAIDVKFCGVRLNRRGINFFSDLQYFHCLRAIIHSAQPDLVLSYTIKPVIYGSIAAARCGVPQIAAMITGAGAAQPGVGVKERVVASVARRLYAQALRHASVVFFQNPDDELMFREHGLLGHGQVVQIPGSGVDLQHFHAAPPVTKPITFLLIARLLANKGVREYALAATKLREKHGSNVRFLLAGPFESGGAGIDTAELSRWQADGVIEYLGALSDVRPAIAAASVYVLPSYREGTPRTVLEAMAMARPVITTDAPGCRETVVDGDNGYLVPLREAGTLAQTMNRFITDPALIPRMGTSSRELAESRFDVNKVNQVILRALNLA